VLKKRPTRVFASSGCGGCHTIEGISFGEVGPNLTQIAETAATRRDGVSAEDYIRESILNTNSFVVDGYQSNVMPQNYSEQLSGRELDDLIEFLLAQD
jgi:mono/diheme cytochrome c family protein